MVKKLLLILVVVCGALLGGCNGGPEPQPEDPHYTEDITGDDDTDQWWSP